MLMLHQILIVIVFTVFLCRSNGIFHKQETIKERHDFVLVKRAHPATQHEVVFHIKQRNLDKLERIVAERSSPHHRDYQRWLSSEEVAALTSNIEGAQQVLIWLESNGIEVRNTPKFHS